MTTYLVELISAKNLALQLTLNSLAMLKVLGGEEGRGEKGEGRREGEREGEGGRKKNVNGK